MGLWLIYIFLIVFLVIGLVFGFCLEIMFGLYGVVVDIYFFGWFFGYWWFLVFAWKLCVVSMGLWLIYILLVGFLVIGLVFGFCLEIMFGFYGVVVDFYFFGCFFGYWLVFGFCLDLCLVSMVVVDFYFFGWFFGYWLVFGFCLEIMFGFYGVVVDLYLFDWFFGYWFLVFAWKLCLVSMGLWLIYMFFGWFFGYWLVFGFCLDLCLVSMGLWLIFIFLVGFLVIGWFLVFAWIYVWFLWGCG